MAAGDFLASALPDALIKMEQMFSGQRLTPELNKPIETINALATRQTVRFDALNILLDAANCQGSKAAFLKACNDDVATSISSCEITGDEIEADSVTLADNLIYAKSFTISEVDCKDIFTASEKLAYAMASAMASLENAVNEAAVAFLAANAQDNSATLPDTWDNSDADLIGIPSSELTPEALAEIHYQAVINNLYSPFLISGRNFYTANVLASFQSAGADNRDGIFRSPLGDIVYDLKNIDTLTSLASTFAVDPSAYAFWCSNQFMNEAPEGWDDQYNTFVWKQRAPRLMFRNGNTLQPVYFDVRRQTSCAVSSNRTYRDYKYQVSFKGGLQLGPQICSASETGILHYKKV